MGLKDLFSIKKQDPASAPISPVSPVPIQDKITFNQYGKEQAQSMGGHPNVILPALHSVYLKVRQMIAEDESIQQQRKAEMQSKIDIIESKNEDLTRKKASKQQELKFEESKIENAKDEIAAIRQDPSRVLKEKGSPRASFIIGLTIIAFLTVYLFVFYSSASYSAFFKVFTSSKVGMGERIFDPQALSHALGEGLMELVLILTIPAVFLGLGYLIHKFSTSSQSKSLTNMVKIGALMAVTFVFDALLAYSISKKIYDLVQANSFSDNAIPYSLSKAFQDTDFWIIIFSGFVVYIIWGLVFNFVMNEYYKLDQVKVTIEELENKIKDYKSTCKSLKSEMSDIESHISSNEAKIKELSNSILGVVFTIHDVKLEINNFVTGWLSYMEFKNFSNEDKRRVIETKDAFLSGIANQFTTVTEI